MTWYEIGAAIIIFMLTANLAAFLVLRQTRGQGSAAMRRRLAADEFAMYASMVAVWVVGFACPCLWPESLWGKALARPWALPCLFAWSVLVGVVLLAVMRRIRACVGAKKR